MAETEDKIPVDRLIDRLGSESIRHLELAAPLFAQARKRKPKIEIRYDLTGRGAGQMMQQGKTLVVRYNLSMAASQPERFIAETVPHEIAHVVVYACYGKVRPHGAEWRNVMAHFGIDNPSRCHEFELEQLPLRSQRRWTYRCGCTTHRLSTTRHHRILRNEQRYLCRKCGAPLTYSPDETR